MNQRACYTMTGHPKQKFWTRREAKRVARRLNLGKEATEKVHVYRCPVCGHFHTGHPTK